MMVRPRTIKVKGGTTLWAVPILPESRYTEVSTATTIEAITR
jgi:hypothetical protein